MNNGAIVVDTNTARIKVRWITCASRYSNTWSNYPKSAHLVIDDVSSLTDVTMAGKFKNSRGKGQRYDLWRLK